MEDLKATDSLGVVKDVATAPFRDAVMIIDLAWFPDMDNNLLLSGSGRRVVLHNNGIRTERAMDALRAFANAAGVWDQDAGTVVGDVLVALRHFCDRAGIDFDAVSERAASGYAEELRGA